MGNILRFCCKEEDDGGDYYPYRYPASSLHYQPRYYHYDETAVPVQASRPQKQQPPPPPPPPPQGIAALLHDLLQFEATSPVTASWPQKQHPPLRPPRPHGVTTLQHDLKFEATSTVPASRPQKQHPPPPRPPRPHGVAALQNDLLNFEATSAVPEGLAEHVESSKKEQVKWYRNMLEAYKDKKPRPKTSGEAAMLVARALSKIQRANLEGVLTFYGFPIPALPPATSENHLSSLPEGVQFVMKTLPVNARCIVDGDGFTAYVDTVDPRESENVPLEVREAVISRAQARSSRNYQRSNALRNIVHEAGYKIMFTSGGEILARKYRIRIRGIDAPEMEMKYGKESQDALVKLIAGKSVTIYAYGQDQFGRYVGDIYCDGVFIQKQMLKKGHAWHFKNYDKRPEFAKWERKAQAARRGLWGSDNPEKPWEWRRNKRNACHQNIAIQVSEWT